MDSEQMKLHGMLLLVEHGEPTNRGGSATAEMLRKMQKMGFKPNEITISGI